MNNFEAIERLQQELDIKEKMLDKFMIGSGETLEKLQQENEELKKEINRLNQPSLIVPMPKQTGVPIEKYEKLYKALEEIKEIIYKCEYDDISCVQCNERKKCNCDLFRLIITKIDEVLNEQK